MQHVNLIGKKRVSFSEKHSLGEVPFAWANEARRNRQYGSLYTTLQYQVTKTTGTTQLPSGSFVCRRALFPGLLCITFIPQHLCTSKCLIFIKSLFIHYKQKYNMLLASELHRWIVFRPCPYLSFLEHHLLITWWACSSPSCIYQPSFPPPQVFLWGFEPQHENWTRQGRLPIPLLR